MNELKPVKRGDIPRKNLLEWTQEHHSEEEMREVFLNMDIALKYIHSHDYCIEIFHPSRIEILNDHPNCVQFDNLMELSRDYNIKKQMINEDIFNSALIQIGLYTHTLSSLTPQFLKENFNEIAQFIPSGDVPYYRGVVQRGASVYFSEFALEKMNRDLKALEQQINESEGKKGINQSSSITSFSSLTNDNINDKIYKQINGMRDAAFINALIIPTIILVSLLLIGIIYFVFFA